MKNRKPATEPASCFKYHKFARGYPLKESHDFVGGGSGQQQAFSKALCFAVRTSILPKAEKKLPSTLVESLSRFCEIADARATAVKLICSGETHITLQHLSSMQLPLPFQFTSEEQQTRTFQIIFYRCPTSGSQYSFVPAFAACLISQCQSGRQSRRAYRKKQHR